MEESGWISSVPLTAPGKAERCETDGRVFAREQSGCKSPAPLERCSIKSYI